MSRTRTGTPFLVVVTKADRMAPIDRDEVLAMFAVDVATGDWDGYTRKTTH